MTVVAGIELNGIIALATDGRCTMNDIIVSDHCNKIVEVGDDFYVGVSGSPSHTALIEELGSDYEDPAELCADFRALLAEREAEVIEERDGDMPAFNTCLVIICPRGVYHVDGELYPIRIPAGHIAVAGSGMESASAAARSIITIQSQLTAAGIPAEINALTIVTHAVKIACETVHSCGGEIFTAVVEKALPENVLPFPEPGSRERAT